MTERPSLLGRLWLVAFAACCAIASSWMTGDASAQPLPDPFNSQARANAASSLILQSVEQGIASLPPTSAQAFSYEFDESLQTFKPSDTLGPISFRAPGTIGQGKIALRFASSYFSLDKTYAPVAYRFDTNDGQTGYTRFGLSASAKVGVLNFGGTYGITRDLETSLAVPVVITDAQASQTFPTPRTDQGLPPSEASVFFAASESDLDDALSSGDVVYRTDGFKEAGFSFNQGTHAGLGRIGLSGKARLPFKGAFSLAVDMTVLFPSPSQAQFAGVDSFALVPRIVTSTAITDQISVLADVGYSDDLQLSTLTGFLWHAGVLGSFARASFDVGVGGASYDESIDWSPQSITADPIPEQGFPGGKLTAQSGTSVGSTFVDFLGGFKFRLAEATVLAGSVVVPVTSDGLRPAAIGTLAIEQYF